MHTARGTFLFQFLKVLIFDIDLSFREPFTCISTKDRRLIVIKLTSRLVQKQSQLSSTKIKIRIQEYKTKTLK